MPELYRSKTRATTLETLPPALATAVRDHAAQRQLDLDGARAWLTHSENPPATGWLSAMMGGRANGADPDLEHWTLVMLLGTHLVLGTLGEKRGCSVLSVPLVVASIAPESALVRAMGGDGPTDRGLYVIGLPGEPGRPGTYMAKLGPDAEGAACYAAVESAVLASRKSPA